LGQIVTNRRLFHINSQGNCSPYELMKPGDAIEVRASTNPFFRFYDVQQRTYRVNEENGAVNQVPAMWRTIPQTRTISGEHVTRAHETSRRLENSSRHQYMGIHR
jgi:hypothetical protein